jgi:hypothetical protein
MLHGQVDAPYVTLTFAPYQVVPRVSFPIPIFPQNPARVGERRHRIAHRLPWRGLRLVKGKGAHDVDLRQGRHAAHVRVRSPRLHRRRLQRLLRGARTLPNPQPPTISPLASRHFIFYG